LPSRLVGRGRKMHRQENMTSKRVTASIVILALLACVSGVQAQQAPDPRVADLIQSGKLRVALGLGSPALAIKDAKSGELRGPALDLARALATKIGVRLEPVEYPRPGAILQGIQNNEWDVTFLVGEPARLAQADFSPPYMQTDFTYLVPAGAAKHSAADMDQRGIRIAVPRGDGSDLRLTNMLKHAELVRMESIAAIIETLRAGQADAYAGPRAVLLELSAQVPGSRVLEDGFGEIVFVAMVPKGKAAHIAYVSEFIEEAKRSGLVQQMVDRYGLKGIQVVGAKISGSR
jgi:polar amino acid transport system substrate-binding protein